MAFTSGEFPILAPPLRLSEFVATLALAQDNAFGQPLESQLRSCLLASWMSERAGFEPEARQTAYWVAFTLRMCSISSRPGSGDAAVGTPMLKSVYAPFRKSRR